MNFVVVKRVKKGKHQSRIV